MGIQTLTQFFMWCAVINGALFVLWTILCVVTPDLVYTIQNRLFPLPRQTFDVVIYSFLGLFKIFFLFFNVVPWLALLLMG